MAVNLGAAFPPDTVIGLRRSASPYLPAHSLAVATDGRLWRWLATEGQIDEPVAAPTLLNTVNNIPLADLANRYEIACATVPLEELFIVANGEEKNINLICPEFALPSTLHTLYVQLDDFLQTKVANLADPPIPPAAFPLRAMLDYKRPNGTRLTVYENNQAVAIDTNRIPYTTTLSAATTLSLTTDLINSGQVRLGLNTFATTDTGTTPSVTDPVSIIVVRGPEGVYDGTSSHTDDPIVADLDLLLNNLIGIESPTSPVTNTTGLTATTGITTTTAVTTTDE